MVADHQKKNVKKEKFYNILNNFILKNSMHYILFFFKILIVIVPVLIAVAYFTLAERKVLGAIQRRRGPNVIGAFGLLQPLADGAKLFFKETVIPSVSNRLIFLLAPIFTFFISLLGWTVIPLNIYSVFSNIELSTFYILAMSAMGVYGIILAGWSSNSKYAFLGALRSTSQMISYEVSMGFIILSLVLCTGSANLNDIVESQRFVWYIIPFFPLAIMFFVSGLAETNRHPFDLPEAEAELVSGYNVEYSAMGFALFSLGEYSNILIMCYLNVIFFWGGWLSPFFADSIFFFSYWMHLKILIFVFAFILLRAALPRYRYDQLMSIGWKVLLPTSLAYVLFTAGLLSLFNIIPF